MESNITRLDYNGKEIILIGTAHVSKNSVDEVRETIEKERPDSICIELDQQRYEAINQKDRWSNTNLVQVIKSKRAGFMFVNILLSNYQRKLAEQFGIESGQEMMEGIACAKEYGAELVLADRSIQITFNRIWRGCSLWEKIKVVFSIILSVVDDEEITEDDLEKLKSDDMLTAALSEMGSAFKGVKKYLVDERDQYLAYKIKNAPGDKVVAVLGAAHVPGIKEEIFKDQDIKKLEVIPPKSNVGKIIGWMIPIVLVGVIVATFIANPSSGWEQAKTWIIWNGALSALGTLIAGGHIVSVVVAFFAAPITSLNPLLAAGWFAGTSEAHFRKPKVEDFESLPKDLGSIKGLWKNKVTKVLMVVVFANLGSVLGTWLGGLNIIGIFINTFS
ncbi:MULTISPECIES: TraB/GumN family protein [unclassified Acetobacterium]|uniref:TraB/GumN family protein n=1 Tax=Acetobacterium TaxID=33951 RepID=UPI000DBEB840|nr:MULTISPECIES: TraB/GumN family protein [unclassified Acetobacterium]AWW28248.1 TraB family protein [Acetobacterium sp. KB-1]MDZ5724989.1 TraB/GumN family protein [Acetobacterium sp. K1/6]